MLAIIDAVDDEDIYKLMMGSYKNILEGDILVALDTVRDLLCIMEEKMQENGYMDEGSSDLFIEDGDGTDSKWGMETGTDSFRCTENSASDKRGGLEDYKPVTRQNIRKQGKETKSSRISNNSNGYITSSELHPPSKDMANPNINNNDNNNNNNNINGNKLGNIVQDKRTGEIIITPHTRTNSPSQKSFSCSESNEFNGKPPSYSDEESDKNSDPGDENVRNIVHEESTNKSSDYTEEEYDMDDMSSDSYGDNDSYRPVLPTRQNVRETNISQKGGRLGGNRKDLFENESKRIYTNEGGDNNTSDEFIDPNDITSQSYGRSDYSNSNSSNNNSETTSDVDNEFDKEYIVNTIRIRNNLKQNKTDLSGSSYKNVKDLEEGSNETPEENDVYIGKQILEEKSENKIQGTTFTEGEAYEFNNKNENNENNDEKISTSSYIISPGNVKEAYSVEEGAFDITRTMRFKPAQIKYSDYTNYALSDSGDNEGNSKQNSKIFNNIANTDALIESVKKISSPSLIGNDITYYELAQNQKEKLNECTEKLIDLRNTLENREREAQVMKNEIRRLDRLVQDSKIENNTLKADKQILEGEIKKCKNKIATKDKLLEQYRRTTGNKTNEEIKKMQENIEGDSKSNYMFSTPYLPMSPGIGSVEGSSTPLLDSTYFMNSPGGKMHPNGLTHSEQAQDGYKDKYEKEKKRCNIMEDALKKIYNVANGEDDNYKPPKITKKTLKNLVSMISTFYKINKAQLNEVQRKLSEEIDSHNKDKEELEKLKKERELPPVLSLEEPVNENIPVEEDKAEENAFVSSRFSDIRTQYGQTTRVRTAVSGRRRDLQKEKEKGENICNIVNQYNVKLKEREKQDFHNMALSVKCILMNNSIQIRLLTNEIWAEIEKNHIRRADWARFVEKRINEEYKEVLRQRKLKEEEESLKASSGKPEAPVAEGKTGKYGLRRLRKK